MNIRFRHLLDHIDVKSILLTILILSICIFLFAYYPTLRDTRRSNDLYDLQGTTVGTIVDVKSNERISNSKTKGTEIYIDSYSVTYQYLVKGQRFKSTEIIPCTMANDRLLRKIFERGASTDFIVKYDVSEPDQSILVE
jgi:hypothetical protein